MSKDVYIPSGLLDYEILMRAAEARTNGAASTGAAQTNDLNLKRLRTIRVSDVTAQKTYYLWKPFIPFGEFTLIDGEDGIGKSLLTLAVGCAGASGKLFDTTETFSMIDSEPFGVLVLSAEESIARTIKPRLLAMNAPTERFIVVAEPFTLDRDGLLRLEMEIAETEAKLVIIDPLFSYTGKVRLNDDNEIRSVTNELIRIAEKYGCAIVGVRHIGKSKGLGDPRAAGLNGVGWRASARSALLVGKDPETGELAICQCKSNAAKSDKSFGFKIEKTVVVDDAEIGEIETGKFLWTGESSLSARQMLAPAGDPDERSEQSAAIAFLSEILASGERESAEVFKEAEQNGFSKRTLNRAKSKLNVKSRKEGFKPAKWFWQLPEDCQDSPEGCQFQELGNLRTNEANKTIYGNDLTEGCQPKESGNLRGGLFDVSPEAVGATNKREPVPIDYNYPCWTCGANVLHRDSRCPNCGQDLNDLPF
jgi:hypothetical protein